MTDKTDSSNLVFIAWSGETSYQVAKTLHNWIPDVIQANPWMSDDDIEKGSRWNPELASKLGKANFGIICLTPDNLEKPWILFEAGALSKALDSYAWTLLFRVKKSDISGPLGQFQHTLVEKEDVRKLIQTINKAMGDKNAITEKILNKAFETCWDELEESLNEIALPSGYKAKERTEREILEEILDIIREIPRQIQLNLALDLDRLDKQDSVRLRNFDEEINKFNSSLTNMRQIE